MQQIVDLVWNWFRDHSMPALLGAVGTFFGAWVALMFERWKAARAETKNRCGDLLEAHLTLVCHANSLYDELLKFAPYRHLPDRERKMPMIVHTFDESRIDVRKLSFLLNSPMPDLVLDIHTVDMCYRSACGALQIRNKMLEDLRASMDVMHHDPNTGLTGGIADLTTATLVRHSTDAAFNCLDDAFTRTVRTIDSIVSAAKRLFPDSSFRVIDFPALPNQKEANHESTKKG